MTGSSVLPATIHNGKIYFLFGKECALEDSAKGFSDFGGGVESGETIYSTAMREGVEEMTGFLGSIPPYIKKGGNGTYHISHNDRYHVHIFFIPYDPKLPVYYNHNHQFLWEKLDQKYLKKTKCFEKIEIQWFSLEEMQLRKKEFRNFYQEIVDTLLRESKDIGTFLKKSKTNYLKFEKSKTNKKLSTTRSNQRRKKRNQTYRKHK